MAQKNEPVIKLDKITKKYGFGDASQNAIDGVSLSVERGEFIAVMGPSGCGKTTLLNILGLLDRPDDGDYLIDGKNTSYLTNARRSRVRAQKIGIIFQNFNLINRMTVIDNVALPLTYHGLSRYRRLEAASKMLKSFHLQEREYYMPWQLSGGQTQRVAIARALINQPSLILADEPTGNLDSHSSHVIMEELAQIHKKGNTIIMVTHNPALTSYASRVIHMLDGKIASDKKISVVSKSASKSTALNVRHQPSTKVEPVAKVKKPKAKKKKGKKKS